MKSILFISFWNPIPTMPFKGIFIHEQINELTQRYSDILFLEVNILPSKKIFKKQILVQPFNASQKIILNIHSILWKFIYINPWYTSLIIKNVLKEKVPEFTPSIIHSNIIYPCGIVGYLLSKKYKSKHIISEHWSKIKNILNHPVYKRIARNAYKKSDTVLCVSNFLAIQINEFTNVSNVLIIPNIINTELFAYKPKKEFPDCITFTCIAHWAAPKRLDLIIDSLEVFANKSSKSLILNVIGNGYQRDKYQKKSFNNFVINWMGYIPKENIPAIFHSTDYFLHASEIETFSIVIGEALSTGTPVLASNKGAIPELINTSNGILIENTVHDWVSGLHLITNIQFNCQAIADNVRVKYTALAVSQAIKEIYDSV